MLSKSRVILNGVKNLSVYCECFQILRIAQNDTMIGESLYDILLHNSFINGAGQVGIVIISGIFPIHAPEEAFF